MFTGAQLKYMLRGSVGGAMLLMKKNSAYSRGATRGGKIETTWTSNTSPIAL